MKKKLIDLTIGELIDICNNNDLCDNCLLNDYICFGDNVISDMERHIKDVKIKLLCNNKKVINKNNIRDRLKAI